MENGTIVAVYNECLFTSSGGGASIRWTDPAEKSVTLERAERSGGVVFDLREVFRAALGEGGEVTTEGALEYDPRICKTIDYGAGDTYGNAVTAVLAMIRRGELEGNDLLDLPYMVQSQRPRREGHLYIPQFEGFPVGISVRQTRNGGGCIIPKTYCVDIGVEFEVYYTFTIQPTPSDATVIINGEQRTSIEVAYGTEVTWEVSADGYVSKSGTEVVTEDVTKAVELSLQTYTFTIQPTPSDATVIINGEQRTSIEVAYGTEVTWEVSADGYVSKSGTEVVTSDTVKEVVLEAEGEIYTLALDDTGTAPWSGDSNHIVRWSQPNCKKYLWGLSATTSLGSVKSVTDIGDPYDAGEINGEIVLNIPANTATVDKTGTLTVRGYDENGDHVVTATVGLTQEAAPSGIDCRIEGTDGTNFNVDSLALLGEREYTFRIRTSEYVEKVHISPVPAYGDHGYGYEYGISSVTLNGVTVGTSGGSVSVEGGKEYDVTVKFHNYHTNINTGANPVTGAYYGCEYSIYITPSYGEYTGSEQEFVIYTSNASTGPVIME